MSTSPLCTGLAWITIPHTELSFQLGDFSYNSWRVYIAFCTIPSLSSALLFVFMPESPKFLLQMGREREAISILAKVHQANRSKHVIKLESLTLSDSEYSKKESYTDFEMEQLRSKTCCQNVGSVLKELWGLTAKLFQGSLLRTTVVLLAVNFALAFGYYGLFLWFPELFDRIDKYGGSFCDLHSGNETLKENVTRCDGPSDDVFFEGFLTSISNLPGNILTVFLVERLGRKFLLGKWRFISITINMCL